MRTRLSSLRLSPTREAEIVDELSQHLDDHYRELIAGGASPEEATRLAIAEFRSGNVLAQRMAPLRQAHEPPPITPGAPTGDLLTEFWLDLRYAARMASKQRGFSLLAVAIMALGIGANAAVFSVVNGVLLKPLPYPNPDRIVVLRASFLASGTSQTLVSIANFRDWRDQSSSFEAMSSYNNNALNVVIRTAADPNALAGTVRRVAAEISPEVPVAFTTMEAAVSKGVEDPRFRALLFGLFAVLAVCLAMAGIYGVMAHSVEQRWKEIALRMALGADQASVLRLILGHGLVLASTGLVLGLAGAVVATRLLETVLFQVRPIDIQVYLAVIGLVAIVTLLAGYVPAWRAAVANPVEVLKAE